MKKFIDITIEVDKDIIADVLFNVIKAHFLLKNMTDEDKEIYKDRVEFVSLSYENAIYDARNFIEFMHNERYEEFRIINKHIAHSIMSAKQFEREKDKACKLGIDCFTHLIMLNTNDKIKYNIDLTEEVVELFASKISEDLKENNN